MRYRGVSRSVRSGALWLVLAVMLALAVPLSASGSSLVIASTRLGAIPSDANAEFGRSCAKDGDTLIVGGPKGSGLCHVRWGGRDLRCERIRVGQAGNVDGAGRGER